jgi:prolyl oligopeptidase
MRATLCLSLLLLGLSGAQAVPPQDASQNVKRTDPQAWLEDVHGAKPLAWVSAQNGKALGILKADLRYQKYYDSILSVLDAPDRIPYGGLDHGLVYNFWQDAKNPKGVWRRTTIASYQTATPKWDVLLDVDALAKTEKQNWVFEGASLSPGQKSALIQLSRGGGDAVVVREFDMGKRAFEVSGFSLSEAKSNATWWGDDRILFGTDTGKGSLTNSGYPRIVKLWHRGEAVADAKPVFEGKNSDVSSSPIVFDSLQSHIALIARAVSFFETEYFWLNEDGTTRKLPLPLSANVQGLSVGDVTHLVATLRQPWTRQDMTVPKGALVALTMDPFMKNGATMPLQLLFAPGSRASVESVMVGRNLVYAAIFDNVTGSVRKFSLGGVDGDEWVHEDLNLPPGGTPELVSLDDYGSMSLFSYQNYLTPPTLYLSDANRTNKPLQPIKALPARFEASGLVTEQFEATSKDGTKIPYFVTRPKALSSPAPTILYGYGGFEVSLTPSYSANFGRLWLNKGGIYVVANIRGGGEFGPAWHDAALKMKRQNAYDDFAAVAEDLVARKLTTPKQLGIMGGSNGGLLVSTVMVQHPELFGAVVCQVPLIDMIAYTHIGAGASWIGEYGDPANKKERDYILTYSPYQNVKAGVKYPPVFFVTATSDDRVTPVHARKMAAKMEGLNADVLFYENTDGGHAAAADHKQNAEMWGLSFVYLSQKLGLR